MEEKVDGLRGYVADLERRLDLADSRQRRTGALEAASAGEGQGELVAQLRSQQAWALETLVRCEANWAEMWLQLRCFSRWRFVCERSARLQEHKAATLAFGHLSLLLCRCFFALRLFAERLRLSAGLAGARGQRPPLWLGARCFQDFTDTDFSSHGDGDLDPDLNEPKPDGDDDEASDCTIASNVQCDIENLGTGKEPDKETDIATQTDLKLHHSVADGTKMDRDDVAAYELDYFGEADPYSCVASSSEQSAVDLDVFPTATGLGGSEQSATDVAILTTLTDQHNSVQLDEQVVPPVVLPGEPTEPGVQPDGHGRGFDSQGSETGDADEDVKSGGLELQWEYMDARGATQGLFSQEQMRELFEARAFPEDLPMRTNPDTPFMTSGLLFPSSLLTKGSEKMVELARAMGVPDFAKAAVLLKGLAKEAACVSLWGRWRLAAHSDRPRGLCSCSATMPCVAAVRLLRLRYREQFCGPSRGAPAAMRFRGDPGAMRSAPPLPIRPDAARLDPVQAWLGLTDPERCFGSLAGPLRAGGAAAGEARGAEALHHAAQRVATQAGRGLVRYRMLSGWCFYRPLLPAGES
ncbi:unnamed protein product [Prorocentrum cordatum]|uniref:GYF domain-containing protein n=1 Tax=Prorocentrum cordatum TaxID=2364126 RepID=A0ABN9TZX1_9DINO|nr:unnamed protein product [Polarella glacialis]